jgi:SAM-dependent methyltransferase
LHSPDRIPLLHRLYAEQQRLTPGDPYIDQHARPAVVRTQAAVFGWYRGYLFSREPATSAGPPPAFTVLDWGCRHAPDSCLLRAAFGDAVTLHAADIDDSDRFAAFHTFARLSYTRLDHHYRLPYPDAAFDVVVGSGTLEHVAMDFESLKEVWRVLKPGGRFVVTYLPNTWSYEEWWKREVKQAGAHPRLYSLAEFRHMLLHHGFRPRALGFQTRHDLIGGAAGWKRWLVRAAGLHRFTSTLCAVAEKAPAMV